MSVAKYTRLTFAVSGGNDFTLRITLLATYVSILFCLEIITKTLTKAGSNNSFFLDT